MKKVLHIVGARPQFIKVNVVIKEIKNQKKKNKKHTSSYRSTL